MEKNGSFKIIAICGLVVSVVALAIGFSAYSAQLNITANGEVLATDEFSPNVNFVANSVDCTTLVGTAEVTSSGTASGKTWSGASISLKAPGDSATCKANVENTSTFIAYLKSLTTASALSCASKTGSDTPATQNITEACSGLTLTINAGTSTATATSSAAANLTSISGNSIAATTGTQEVSFTLSYAAGSAIADGDITVTIPQINLNYSTEN